MLYAPVVMYVAWLGLRFRGPTVFTAANPAFPAGGVVGESKADILDALLAGGAPVACFRRLPASLTTTERWDRCLEFVRLKGFPVVLKPDVGERGRGVCIAHNLEALRRGLAGANRDWLVQEYVPGPEFGLFYCRYPDERRGRLLAITVKRMPAVEGDGRRTLKQLILDDERARCIARVYLGANADRLEKVPAAGERVTLVDIGSHCRGAIFLDGDRLRTDRLEEAVEAMARSVPGFSFGRFDIRVPSATALRRGQELRILELNGVTSECTNIYDPSHGVVDAWRVLFRQWRIAFEIGNAHRRAGARAAKPSELIAMIGRAHDRRVPRGPTCTGTRP
ncbi:MAG: hypothetical protein R3344_09735 [Acidobacteriota bacterium]|nr:hypothetical protein [Acidobacteriota bacterium]